MRLKDFSKLLRVGQWYKNLLVFSPLIFASGITYELSNLFLAFIGFSLISSVTYIFNDWMDRKKDALHPKKKDRPIASGSISGKTALLVAITLFIIVSAIAYKLGIYFTAIVAIYFVSTNLYSLGLKNIPGLDILLISSNFGLRALSGTYQLPGATTLPYFALIFAVLFILLAHKRSTDRKFLKEKAASHKPVLKYYTPFATHLLIAIGYLGVSVCTYYFIRNGIDPTKLFGGLIWLIVTSYYLSQRPETVLKPSQLFKIPLWDVIFILAIALLFI